MRRTMRLAILMMVLWHHAAEFADEHESSSCEAGDERTYPCGAARTHKKEEPHETRHPRRKVRLTYLDGAEVEIDLGGDGDGIA